MGQAASMCRFRGCRYKKQKSNKSTTTTTTGTTTSSTTTTSSPATGLHVRVLEDLPTSRMIAEQGGIGLGSDNMGSHTGVSLQLHKSTTILPKHHHQHHQNQHQHQQQQQQQHEHCKTYDAEYARMEAWMDENQEFVQDYIIRKATRQMVDAWLVAHATSAGSEVVGSPTHGGSGSTTPVRKISADEFERGGLIKPIVNRIDGTPTFLSVGMQHDAYANNTSCGHPVSSGICNQCHRPQRLSTYKLKQLDEKELIFELVKDICNELEVRKLCHKILQNVSILLNADRGSLFLVEGPCNGRNGPTKCLVSKLFDVRPRSTLEEMEKQEEVRVAWGTGIAGYVAESGDPVNIPDAYLDNRFNREVDTQTGYRTKTLLCMPIKDASGDVIGVAQVINKLNGECFTESDEKVFASYLQFCGIGLRNAHLYQKSQLEVKRNQVMLDLARMTFEEQSTLEHMVFRILTHMQTLIQCQRVQILLVHEASRGSFSRVFDFEANDLSEENSNCKTSPYESRFPINIGITGYVAATGETVNIPNAYEDSRFDPSVDESQTFFKHKSILCMAIKNSIGQIIGVIQLINKFGDLIFTKNDENFVEAFAIFCGMGIHNTHMYEKAVVAMAKQSVTLEVLSYHASASIEDANRLRKLRVPSAAHFMLHDFKFDDIHLDDDDTLKACLRMFLDLDFVERFHIDYEVLCRWILSVKKNYRNVIYHNWRHAFNVAQMMFAILTTTQWWKIFGEIECLALMIACLCHDLDHRGTNNSFQIKASSPLAQLYSTSTMEHHHFDQCLMILNSPGNQILAHLSSEEYRRVINFLEDAILATDLAFYFRHRGTFFQSVKDQPSIGYWASDEPRAQLRAMTMTVCDLAAITKPWDVEKRVADLVSSEFFEQGDMEKQELHITPIDIMNREKEDELPMMQVDFIETICMPVYLAFAELSNKLEPLVEGVRVNRQHWLQLAEEVQNKSTSSLLPRTNDNNSSGVTDDTSPVSTTVTKGFDEKITANDHQESNNDDKIHLTNGFTIPNNSGSSSSSSSSSSDSNSNVSTPSSPKATVDKILPPSPVTGVPEPIQIIPTAVDLFTNGGILQHRLEAQNCDKCVVSVSVNSGGSSSSTSSTSATRTDENIRNRRSMRKSLSLKDIDEDANEPLLHNQRLIQNENSKSTSSIDEVQYNQQQQQTHHQREQQDHHHHRQQHQQSLAYPHLTSTSSESDKIPKIVGRLNNYDSRQFINSYGTRKTDKKNGICFPSNGHLHFLPRRHSETNGTALSCDK